MAISTKAELKTAITDWSHRADLASKSDDFIRLAESRLANEIYFREFETETGLTGTVGSRYITLPVSAAAFVRPIELWLTYFNPREWLRYTDPGRMPLEISSGIPCIWTVDSGGRLAFDCEMDKAYTFDFRYVAKPELATDAATNWILQSSPDVYLYASLIELAQFTRDPESVSHWSGLYGQAIQSIKNREHRGKAKETMGLDVPMGENTLRHGRLNIFEGW